MVPRPARAADPLQVPRRSDDLIVGDGVAAGVVEVVGPFVDVLRTRLDGHLPTSVRTDHCNALRSEHAEDFLHLKVAQVFGDDEVDQIVDVGQSLAVESVGGDVAVKAGLTQAQTQPLHGVRIGVEAVYLEARVRTEGGRQFTVADADVDDESPADLRLLEDVRSSFLRRGCRGACRNETNDGENALCD